MKQIEVRNDALPRGKTKPALTVEVQAAPMPRKCKKCHGTGTVQYRPGKWEQCDKCGGSGSA